MKLKTRSARVLAAIGVLAVTMPVASHADGNADEWRFNATIYAWLPSLSGDVSFPTGPGGGGGGVGSGIDVSAEKILDALQFTFMGMLDAQKGKWGIGTDVIYLDLASSKKNTRDLVVGGGRLPVDVTAKVDMGLSGWLWTTYGKYRLLDEPNDSFDVLAGARMLNLKSDLKWHLDGDISSLPLPGRDGRADVSDTLWDGIIGLKGRVAFGTENRWFIPYYADVGTGDSDLTWQAFAGIGYQFDWGSLIAVYRYLDYQMSSKDVIQGLTLDGPAFGVSFRF
jgi:hypothetical protein